ncbi:MAG: hypothetical protein ABFD98_13215 [Syntrophobacteraceae bacterium]|nr:hypothetical protein [Desulfobacteraceae bacterium]
MRVFLRSAFAVVAATALCAGTAMGQTYKDSYGSRVNNGVNRGYVGSDSYFKSQMRSAANRQMMKQSMQRSSGKKAAVQSKKVKKKNTAPSTAYRRY